MTRTVVFRFLRITSQGVGTITLLLGMLLPLSLAAQGKISCSDGDHYHINIREVAIQYESRSFEGTLRGLSVLTTRISVEPKRLQEAAEATQLWNEYLKGLIAGYNSCAVTKAQYNEGLQRISQLKKDAADLKQFLDGQGVDEAKLRRMLSGYFRNLKRLVQLSGQEQLLERIMYAVEKTEGNTQEILRKLEALGQGMCLPSPAMPSWIQTGVTSPFSLGQDGLDAELSPFSGLVLSSRGGLDALGQTDLGLMIDEKVFGSQSSLLATFPNNSEVNLSEKVDLDGDLRFVQQALNADALVSGLGRSPMATVAHIGPSSREGDSGWSLSYTQLVLKVDEEMPTLEYPSLSTLAKDIGITLQQSDDLGGVLSFAQPGLNIAPTAFGLQDSTIDAHANIAILKDKGDWEGSASYTQLVLKADHGVIGFERSLVATVADDIMMPRQETDDLGSLASFVEPVPNTDGMAFGLQHFTISSDVDMKAILNGTDDVDRALDCFERALGIVRKAYGSEDARVKSLENKVKLLRQETQNLLEGIPRT